eukprot:sb/3474752/
MQWIQSLSKVYLLSLPPLSAYIHCTTLPLSGPRYGRFDANGNPNTMPHQSSTFQTVGVLILWVGWYGFNCGSTLTVDGGSADVAGLTAVTTTISATASGLTSPFPNLYNNPFLKVNSPFPHLNSPFSRTNLPIS